MGMHHRKMGTAMYVQISWVVDGGGVIWGLV